VDSTRTTTFAIAEYQESQNTTITHFDFKIHISMHGFLSISDQWLLAGIITEVLLGGVDQQRLTPIA